MTPDGLRILEPEGGWTRMDERHRLNVFHLGIFIYFHPSDKKILMRKNPSLLTQHSPSYYHGDKISLYGSNTQERLSTLVWKLHTNLSRLHCSDCCIRSPFSFCFKVMRGAWSTTNYPFVFWKFRRSPKYFHTILFSIGGINNSCL